MITGMPEGRLPFSPETDLDADLMQDVAAGSETALTQLVHRHQQSLLAFFVRMGAGDEGEDLVQETFIRLYRSRRRYRPTARFTTFLYVLARHVLTDRYRKQRRQERIMGYLRIDAEITPRLGTVKRRQGRSLDVQTALDQLSPKLKTTLVLNVFQGLRYQEIADILQIPLGTVKSRINQALDHIRSALREP